MRPAVEMLRHLKIHGLSIIADRAIIVGQPVADISDKVRRIGGFAHLTEKKRYSII